MKSRTRLFALLTTLLLAACASPSVVGVVDPEDQRDIDSATCAELGVATFATLGLGLFSLDNNMEAQDALGEIRGLRIALETAIKKRNCRK